MTTDSEISDKVGNENGDVNSDVPPEQDDVKRDVLPEQESLKSDVLHEQEKANSDELPEQETVKSHELHEEENANSDVPHEQEKVQSDVRPEKGDIQEENELYDYVDVSSEMSETQDAPLVERDSQASVNLVRPSGDANSKEDSPSSDKRDVKDGDGVWKKEAGYEVSSGIKQEEEVWGSGAGDDYLEDISVTDKSSMSQKDRSVQSAMVATALPEWSLSANLYEKNSMVNTLFKTFSTPYYNGESNQVQVTVFLPDNRSVTSVHAGNTNVLEFKKYIAPFVDTEPEKLLISLMGNSSGNYINDWTPLIGIPPNSVGGLVLNLSFKYEAKVKNVLRFPSGSSYSPIVTARKVEVEDALGRKRTVNVVTEDISYVKEWLGGFRNKSTGQMYHNARTETRFWEVKSKTEGSLENNSRDAQTHLPYLNKVTQVDANKATQMWRPDHYVQSVGDKVVEAKPYVEYDRLTVHGLVVDSVVKIQRWYRRLRSRRNVTDTFIKILRLMKKQQEKKNAAEAVITNEKLKYLISISFPTSRNDFFNLNSVIGMWWKREYNKISKIKSISERRAAYYDLLQSEIELLSALERQRIKYKSEAIKRKELKILEETSRPIVRHQRKGNMTVVETLEVQRAREIKEIYMTYCRKDQDKNERIQVLLSLINVMETLEEVDRTKDLIALMRREIDLISMGLKDDCLQGLRRRIEIGVLYFVHDKSFNPQVKDLRPINFPRVDQRSFLCLGCRKLKNPANSPVHVRLKCYRNCKSCDWLQMTAHCVFNIAPYAAILDYLRAKEITKCPRITHCFALQPFGAYFIINNIWQGKSALSESTNLPELRLCRWDNKQEWSPWNTILLTMAEAEIHERIYDNSEVYEDEFIQAVKIKLIRTRFTFQIMDETDIYCRDTGLWDSAHDENIYQHIIHRREALQPVDPVFKLPKSKAFVRTAYLASLRQSSNSRPSV